VFARFIHTIIAEKYLPDLDELIEYGDDIFFELLNHRALDWPAPFRSLSNRGVKPTSGKGPEKNVINHGPSSREVPTLRISNDPATQSLSDPAAAFKDALRHEKYINRMTGYFIHLITHAMQRRFVVTRKGYMGFGVKSAAIGYQVAVLSTCGNIGRTPYCIRSKGTRFESIGGTYIHELNFNDDGGLHWEAIDLI
jgi:hypothetical protein